jgi:hypothetical protein
VIDFLPPDVGGGLQRFACFELPSGSRHRCNAMSEWQYDTPAGQLHALGIIPHTSSIGFRVYTIPQTRWRKEDLPAHELDHDDDEGDRSFRRSLKKWEAMSQLIRGEPLEDTVFCKLRGSGYSIISQLTLQRVARLLSPNDLFNGRYG